MPKLIRKTLEEVLVTDEIEINPAHVGDWQHGTSGDSFRTLKRMLKTLPTGNFNFVAAMTAPKSIRFRQRDGDFEGGKKGDYLFVDQNGGKMAVPYKIFKLLFL